MTIRRASFSGHRRAFNRARFFQPDDECGKYDTQKNLPSVANATPQKAREAYFDATRNSEGLSATRRVASQRFCVC
jgi:hypothetical protein